MVRSGRTASATRAGLDLAGVEEVLGRPPLTFARWVEDHRADFAPPA